MGKINFINHYEVALHEASYSPQKTYCYQDLPLPVYVNLLNTDYLSNVISSYRIETLLDKPYIINILDSQTGSGKTTLALKKILPCLKKRRKKLLYIVPRLSLSYHLKLELAKLDKQASIIFSRLNEKGIQETKNWGDIDIITYQGIMSIPPQEIKKYGAMVLDECHYFTSESSYNSETEKQLNYIISNSNNVCKFYITATPKLVFDTICMAEFKYSSRYEKKMISLYHFKPNYEHIIPHFFESTSELKNIITNSSCKWLIFVNSIEAGNELNNFLNKELCSKSDNEKISSFLDAAARNDVRKDTVSNLITNETFTSKAMILTSAFDTGINIFDKNLSVVLYSNDETEFLQELGRKRITEGEKVNVYIFLPTVDSLNKNLQSLRRTYDNDKDIIESCCNKSSLDLSRISFPLTFDKNKITYNHLTMKNLWQKINSQNELLLKLEDSQDKRKDIACSRLEWMGLENQYSETMIHSFQYKDANKSALLNLVKPYINKQISNEEFDVLKFSVSNILDVREDQRRERKENFTTTALNKVIATIGFKAKKVSDYYIIIPLEEKEN